MGKFKPPPDRLPGTFENRVFVGGQYDFMPVLRQIAQYVREVGPPLVGRVFEPIIPYDYDIREEQTIDWDLAILGQCQHAIFDLSDIGAQLVEMQEAKQKQTMISSLVVYPVRDKNRRHEPERGKRTVYSFGLPYFGYIELEELKDVIARFLHGGPRSEEWPVRHVSNPDLQKCLRVVKLLRGKDELQKAWEYLADICDSSLAKSTQAIELWLEKALIGTLIGSSLREEAREAWKKASSLISSDRDKAEWVYYKGLAKHEKGRIAEVIEHMKQARQLAPEDARFAFREAFCIWELADKEKRVDEKVLNECIYLTEKALAEEIHDVLLEINARNNLAYFYCDLGGKVDRTRRIDYIRKALQYSEGLPSYHRLFRRMHGYWLDTRAWVLLLQAEEIIEGNAEGDTYTLIDNVAEAVQLFRFALELDRDDKGIAARAEKARELKKRAAEWLRNKAKEGLTKAQTSLRSDFLYEGQKLSLAADEFDPPLKEETSLQSEKDLSLLVELKQLLDSKSSSDDRDDFVRRVTQVVEKYVKYDDKGTSA